MRGRNFGILSSRQSPCQRSGRSGAGAYFGPRVHPRTSVLRRRVLTMRIVFVFLGCFVMVGCLGSIHALPPHSAADRTFRPVEQPNGYTSIYSFSGAPDGAIPYAGLVDVKGTLYGTTSTGGLGGGVIFKITPSGVEKVLYSFKTGEPNSPIAPLILVNGALYGTAPVGGPANCGSVFRVTLGGSEKTLHAFKNNADGCLPEGPLLNVRGTLYGTTKDGGKANGVGVGTVFKITTSGSEKVIYAFKGSNYNDAGSPAGGLTNVKGVLYGTSDGGGNSKQQGTIYRVTLSGSEKVLHAFNGNDGDSPLSTLVSVNGKLYGTTSSGGAKNLGTVFSMSTSGAFKLLHSFHGADGATPPFGALVDFKGALYGVTSAGGKNNAGAIFKLTTAGKETVLYSFGGGFDGTNPGGALINVGSTLFGTTAAGGYNGKGTVYSIQP